MHKKKSNIRKKKSHHWGLIISIVLILAGIFTIPYPYIHPQAMYSELQTKNITVDNLEWINAGRYGASSHYLLTAVSGENYTVTGHYSTDELLKYVQPGTVVNIKYDSDNHIEELNVHGKTIVTYWYKQKMNQAITCILGLLSIATGVGGLLFARFDYLDEKRKKEMRKAKLQKKYGDAYKEI